MRSCTAETRRSVQSRVISSIIAVVSCFVVFTGLLTLLEFCSKDVTGYYATGASLSLSRPLTLAHASIALMTDQRSTASWVHRKLSLSSRGEVANQPTSFSLTPSVECQLRAVNALFNITGGSILPLNMSRGIPKYSLGEDIIPLNRGTEQHSELFMAPTFVD